MKKVLEIRVILLRFWLGSYHAPSDVCGSATGIERWHRLPHTSLGARWLLSCRKKLRGGYYVFDQAAEGSAVLLHVLDGFFYHLFVTAG